MGRNELSDFFWKKVRANDRISSPMQEEKKNKIDWKPAVEIFTQVSTWIAVPIVLALIFGKMLDVHYGTRPWIFVVLSAIAFIISCYGIVKIVTKYIDKMKEK